MVGPCSLSAWLSYIFFWGIWSLFFQDSRLLGEIHVALLRTIIKDIEDVARTPSTGLGVNQNNVANPGGGHPHIVEGVSFYYNAALFSLA